MRVVILPNKKEASSFAAEFIENFIAQKENLVLGLATGSSVLLTYKDLIKKHTSNGLSFKKVTTFNLDAVSYTHLTLPTILRV